jgi:hypothetical protein
MGIEIGGTMSEAKRSLLTALLQQRLAGAGAAPPDPAEQPIERCARGEGTQELPASFAQRRL